MQKITVYIMLMSLVVLCHTAFSAAEASGELINCDSDIDCPYKFACLQKFVGKGNPKAINGKVKGLKKCYPCECALLSQCYLNGSKDTVCNCTGSGFEGEFCNISTLCALNPCQNGGTCSQTGATTFVCICPPSYTGTTCEQPAANPCRPNPCLNGGSCNSEGSGFKCSCPPGITGDLCQTQLPV